MTPRRASFFFATLLFVFSAHAAEPAEACLGQMSLPLDNEKTGHVSVLLTINGVEARMLVDTGANMNTLDVTEGKRVNPTVVPYLNAPPGAGFAKLTISVGSTLLGTQDFGVMDLNFINVPSKQVGAGPFLGQLGASFFKDYKAKIDFNSMVLCISGNAQAT